MGTCGYKSPFWTLGAAEQGVDATGSGASDEVRKSQSVARNMIRFIDAES